MSNKENEPAFYSSAQLPSFDISGKQQGWPEVPAHQQADHHRIPDGVGTVEVSGADADNMPSILMQEELIQEELIQPNLIQPELIQDEDLSPELVLKNLPMHISSLNSHGVWQPMGSGKNEYFSSLDVEDFTTWVSHAVHVQDRVAILKAVSDCRSEDRITIAAFRLLNLPNMPQAPQWAEIKCSPIANQTTILTVLRDISERKLQEIKTLQEHEAADAANIAKTRFLTNISHELRTPLNAIIGFSEILKSGMVPATQVEKQQEYQGLINDSAQHLLAVLNDILDMSKIEAGKYEIFPEDIDITQIIVSCCSMLMPLAKKAGVELSVENPHEALRLEADSKAIRQILINLISNAIRFTRPDTIVQISALRVGRKIELKICDQGQGISADALEHLGKPFHQVDSDKSRRHEGTGLGLSIVKGLVQLHDGSFNIESEINVGSVVTIGLPHSPAISRPVPGQDADAIIKIKPNTMEPGHNISVISRLVG